MIKRIKEQCVILLLLAVCGCGVKDRQGRFDQFNRKVDVGSWQFGLRVDNLSEQIPVSAPEGKHHYLKATLSVSNLKTGKSLLYSASKDGDDYDAKYKYLSFGSGSDLYISYKDEVIDPIGYVFEPSNGLSQSERLVYKFQIDDDLYRKLKDEPASVEYWYIDRLAGLGKICFTHNN